MIDYEFLYAFSRDVLRVDESIRWIGITNKFGVLLNVEQKEGEAHFLTEEEQEEYVSNSITRYKKLSRATIPIISDGYYMLLIFDAKATNFDEVIMKKVLPLTEKERHRFIVLGKAG